MNLWKDIRFALRTLASKPTFLLVAISSMALGIGANTAIVSLIDAVLWRTLPVSEAHELILLDYEVQRGVRMGRHNGYSSTTDRNSRISTSFKYPSFLRFRDQQNLFKDLFAFAPLGRSNLNARGASEMIEGQLVSGNYFTGLRMDPFLGRLIDPQDDRPDAPAVLVLDYEYWQSRFGGDPSILGESVSLNQQPFTVIGVLPPAFQGTLQIGARANVSVPIASGSDLSPFSAPLMDENYWWIRIMGRPQPGVSRATIEGALSNLVTANLTTPPTLDEGSQAEFPVHVRVQDGSQGLQEVRAELGTPLFAISAIAGLILLLCCANVAGLLVARGAIRGREMAVRLSLGATRWRLVRQLLVESVLIAFSGSAVGLLVAMGLRGLLAAQFTGSGSSPLLLDLSFNAKVLAATAIMAIFTGLAFGLAPALKASSINLVASLKEGALSATRSRSRQLLGRILVGGQVALSVLVLTTAGLFLGTLQNLRSVEVGFNPENVLLFRVEPKLSGYQHQAQLRLQRQIREQIGAIPGVLAVTTMDFSPVGGGGSSTSGLLIEGEDGEEFSTDLVNTAPNLFQTLDIPIRLGRGFSASDTAQSPRVAIISEELARSYFGGENPLGRRISFDADSGFNIEVIGIAGDVKNRTLRTGMRPIVYFPESQSRRFFYSTFAVRSATYPNTFIPSVRAAMQTIDPNLPIYNMRLYRDQIRQDIHSETQFARLTSLFAAVGLILACIGLYGILTQSVTQRTREFGIRIALGAGRSRVVSLVMKEIYLVVLGVIAGIGLSFLATRALDSLLFDLTPSDPWILGSAALAMLLAGMVAVYLPARRASATDPLRALRAE